MADKYDPSLFFNVTFWLWIVIVKRVPVWLSRG